MSKGHRVATWARWLLELANGVIVALVLVYAIGNLAPFSDDEIRSSLVDTYDASALAFLALCMLAALAAGASLLAYWLSGSLRRKRLAVIQLALVVACLGASGFAHLRLMQRTTRLTGQTFGGFP